METPDIAFRTRSSEAAAQVRWLYIGSPPTTHCVSPDIADIIEYHPSVRLSNSYEPLTLNKLELQQDSIDH